MSSFRSIVVGTDGSESAARAVRQAALLSAAVGSVLHVVRAYEPDPRAGPDAAALVREGLGILAAEVRGIGAEVVVHALEGDPVDAILDVAEQAEAELVVVGDRGMGSSRRRFLGSVPDSVSHHASCSVLIVGTTGETRRRNGSGAGQR